MAPPAFSVDDAGRLRLDLPGGGLIGATWNVRAGRVSLGTRANVDGVARDERGATVRWSSELGLAGTWRVDLDGDALTVRLAVTNTGDRPVPLVSLEPLVLDPRRGGVVALPGAPATWSVRDVGFQSWSPSRALPATARPHRQTVLLEREFRVQSHLPRRRHHSTPRRATHARSQAREMEPSALCRRPDRAVGAGV